MYSGRSFRFVRSGSLPISCYSLSYVSVACALLVLNVIFWCLVLYIFRYLINHIVSLSQFTSGLCLTNQLCFKNMSVLFKSITTILIYFLCPLILILSSINLVTSLFLISSTLNTSNEISTGFVLILSSLTNCSLRSSVLIKIIFGLPNIYKCISFFIYHSYFCFVILSSFCRLVSLTNWGNCYLSFFEHFVCCHWCVSQYHLDYIYLHILFQ